MLVIRLFRVGKKNQPSFKIVVTDKRNPPRGGRFVEEVGFWNPLTKEKTFDAKRIKYWLSKGVQPSKTIHNFLVAEKMIEEKKIPKHKKPKAKEEAKEEKKLEKPEEIKKKPKEEPKEEIEKKEREPEKEQKKPGEKPEKTTEEKPKKSS